MSPRIAYNALALRPGGTGVQTYIRELLTAMVSTVDAALVATVQADAVDDLPAAIEPRVAPVVAGARRAFAGLIAGERADLFHGLNVDLPLQRGTPMVATVHDMSVFDVSWTMPRRVAAGKRLVYRRALRRADAVIAVSAFTADRLQARLGREAAVIALGAPTDLAPPDVDAIALGRKCYGLPPAFALHVGTIEPRKNLAMVAEACNLARLPLVLAGPRRPSPALAAKAMVLGYVPRAHLAALYGAATAVVFPSHYEGFGLTAVEAMACGAPVLAARSSALREVVGDAGILLGADDPREWAGALATLLADAARRGELTDAGLRRAALMTWKATAEATADVYATLGVRARA